MRGFPVVNNLSSQRIALQNQLNNLPTHLGNGDINLSYFGIWC